jgi:myo-inositol 2-dehydrogenase/D-chiro-inositol 1-dehydrogenase
MNNKALNIGVIGTGGMGARHARNLALHTANANVVAVMDMDGERAGAVAEECGGAAVYTDPHAMIAATDVDAVVIASPDSTHTELAMACIAAGKPVLCEKPLATNVADAGRVMEAEVAAGQRLVQLGFMREYDEAHYRVRELVRGGELGAALYFRGTHTNLNEGGARTIEDVIINSAIHDIHSARWLMGGTVTEVTTRHITVPGEGPQSCRLALIDLRFDSGALATLEANVDAVYGYEVRIEVMCEGGSISSDGLSGVRQRRPLSKAQAIEADWLERFDAAYRTEAAAWVEAVRTGTPAGPSTWDGYISMIIADTCVKSAISGKPEAVPVVEQPGLYE